MGRNIAYTTLFILLFYVAGSSSCAGGYGSMDELRVLPKTINGVLPRDMMKAYLLLQADEASRQWKADYEKIKTPEQIAEYQQRMQRKFIEALGGLPKRTALNPQITGVVRREGYRVEKVIFESRPKHYVTALMFIPESPQYRPPYPGVLIPCGHSRNGKAYELYQKQGASLALNGMAALVFDPIDQGERGQLLDEKNLPPMWGVPAHTMIGVGSILLGRNTARFEIWDGIRAVDYLQSHPQVDAERIGCSGNSGGGTQTSYLMALDERIYAAAPGCYITSFNHLLHTIGCQDAEQNIYGQLAFGMEHADYIMMRAPKPTLICAATQDFFDIDGTWQTYRYAKRFYSRMGLAERVDLIENDAEHGYKEPLREGVVRWMARWLLNKDEPITESEIKLLDEKEVLCTPTGQIMLLEGARSVYDLNEDYEKELSQRRRELWAGAEQSKMLEKVRQIAKIRSLEDLPRPAVEKLEILKRPGCQIEKLILKPEEGVYLPALLFRPEQKRINGVVLYLNEDGKEADASAGGPIEKLVKAGKLVLAVDLRGHGETRQTVQRYGKPYFGKDCQDMFAAYVLGRSYVGMRAEDVLVCARYAAEKLAGKETKKVELTAVGSVAVPALHAAALEPELFKSVRLSRMIPSWSNIIHSRITYNQLTNTIHGVLTVYDLPDLAETLSNKIVIEEPLNACEKPHAK